MVSLVIVFVFGIHDAVKMIDPEWTLNASLLEKYQDNESFTSFGAFKKGLGEEEITRQRKINYDKLLSMERRNARQRLFKLGLLLIAVGLLNAPLIWIQRSQGSKLRE